MTWKKGNNFFPEKGEKKVKRNALLSQKIEHFVLYSTLRFRTENLLSMNLIACYFLFSKVHLVFSSGIVLSWEISSTSWLQFVVKLFVIYPHGVLKMSFWIALQPKVLNIEYYDTGKQNITRLKKKKYWKLRFRIWPRKYLNFLHEICNYHELSKALYRCLALLYSVKIN